jgi:hypothetical protein
VRLRRLLNIGIQVLTIVETLVRQKLFEQTRSLKGLYAGNAMRQTRTSSAELLLGVFKEVTLTLVEIGDQWHGHLSTLMPLQQEILSLIGLSPGLYEDLSCLPPKPS